ncbi:hypothetical protein KI387_029071, partial [Taxus chinensis]
RSTGQLGHRDANRPIRQQTVYFRWFGDICPRQSGTVGTNVCAGCEGREKVKRPQ